MPTCITVGVTMMHITNGTRAPGGSRIIRSGSGLIIRNGPDTVIGTIIIIGMIAPGGKRTTPGGRERIIPAGSSCEDRLTYNAPIFERRGLLPAKKSGRWSYQSSPTISSRMSLSERNPSDSGHSSSTYKPANFSRVSA